MASQKKKIFQNFKKLNKRIRFNFLKMQMAESVEVSIVASSRCITLKLFWRTLENDVKKGTLFHNFLQAFYKNLVTLVFWNKHSPFVSIFMMTDWKLVLI